ncbi:Os03g0190400 [Oryza sativa Japonica Group]|uniref:Os03g0190400 protein n=1 Tax=Oryza sativa subsp. japonica TaxID=39947 RepID=A0A0P0VUB9_ORYSJ|nr:hypothetical protein EE612_015790 [Oryza sativa]BAS82712.1 Os03g0190400 [Oryza sativa Japonica Group]
MRLPDRLTARRLENGEITGMTVSPIPDMCATDEDVVSVCMMLFALMASPAMRRRAWAGNLPPNDEGSPISVQCGRAVSSSSSSCSTMHSSLALNGLSTRLFTHALTRSSDVASDENAIHWFGMGSWPTAIPLFLTSAVAAPASSVSDAYPSCRCSADGTAAGTVAAGRCRFRWLRRSSLHHSFRLRDGSTWLDEHFFSMTWSALHVVFTDAAGLSSGAPTGVAVAEPPAGKAMRSP